MLNKSVLFTVVVIGLLLFLYIANLQSLYFLNDDNIYIPASKNFNFLYGTSFRPVSDITLFIDYSLWSNNATGYHITSFFLHLVTAILIFFLAKKIFINYSTSSEAASKSLLVSILFFFYPFHSEAIFWIIGRGAVLAALFGCASLLSYLNIKRSWWFLSLAILFFLIGAFAYETIWIVPVIIIVITYFEIKLYPAQKKYLLRGAVIFWTFFLMYLVIRTRIIGEVGGSPYGSSAIMNFDIRRLVKNYNVMMARSFLPPLQSSFLLIALYSLLLVLAFLLLKKLIVQKRLSKSILIAFAGFMISFLPVLTLGVDSHDSESERFLYFPSVFALLLLTDIVFELCRSSYKRILIFLVFFCAEVFYLGKAASIYQTSSNVAKVTMAAIGNLDDKRKLYCINLPEQYKGGLIYRDGFSQAVSWLAGKKSESVIIISRDEIIRPSLSYSVKCTTLNDLPRAEAASILKKLVPLNFTIENSIILKWTDSCLQIIK
jgi:hypothetical protein